MSNSANEAAWIAAARGGDQEAFWRLVERHGPMVHRLLNRITGNRERADDLFSETFLRAADHIGDFRGDARFSTWLAAIAVNLARNEIKRDRRHTSLPWEEVIPEEAHRHGESSAVLKSWEDPHDVLEQKELREVMDEAIRSLPPKYRVVFVLRDVEGLSTEETARALGLSITAVKSRAVRARLAMRKFLAPYFEGRKRSATRA